ncbi:MAG: extracellular solute-binding protein [Pirellulales bacterium]
MSSSNASRSLDRRTWLRRSILGGSACAWLSAASCVPKPAQASVTAYVALDREFSAPWLEKFQAETKIEVIPKYDVESTKTVGLVNALLLERQRPHCDVFWNNEILHTLRLQREGLLEPFDTPVAQTIPPNYRDPQGCWYGFAARARVLLVNHDMVDAADEPTTIEALADSKWKGKAGIAKPLFGTTASHAAVLFARWGRARAEKFFRAVQENALTMSGNKQVAVSVGRGQLAWGLTDTDDAIVEIESGSPVHLVYPDQASDQDGTLLIPNTLAVIRHAPHAAYARQLVEYLLRPEVEESLARGPSAQFPLHRQSTVRPRVVTESTPRWMEVDFHAAAEAWDHASRWLKQLYFA